MKHSNGDRWTRRYARILAGTTATAVLALASTASAAFSDGVPAQVEYGGPTAQLLISLNGSNFVGQIASPNCGGVLANSADSVKIWESQAQAAFLSGKRLRVYYTTCPSGVSYIADVVLMN
jgi:hypothetical protein